MKFFYLTIVLFLFPVSSFTQDVNRVIPDPELDQEILIGYIDMDGITSEVFAEYYISGYEEYIPDTLTLNELLVYGPNDFDYLIVLGSWCEDSHREVPRMLKVLDELEIDPERISMIAVDQEKEADGTNVEIYNIDKVPSLVILSGKDEIGRIIEIPSQSIEADLLNILSR